SRLAKLEYESKNDIVTIRTNFPTEELREGVAYEGDISNATIGNISASEDTYDSAIPSSAIRNYFIVSRFKRNSKHPHQSMPYQGVLMVNLITETEPNAEHRKLRLTIDNPWTGVNNVVLRNVEKPESYYFHNSLERSFLLYKGDAKLFDLAPVVHIGGSITANESLNETMELIENDLIINSGAELTVNSFYQCNKNIIINSGATLRVNSTGKIKFNDGTRLVCYGKLVINGGEIDFSSPIANNCVMVQDGAELIINGGIISNGRYGINLNGKATVKVNNAAISNCQDAVLLFDFGARIPSIIGCNISGCINGITAINGEFVVIKDNTITTSGGYGITLDLVSQPFIVRNTITDANSGASYSGIFSLLSGGYYRQNNISNYGIGVLLSESIPYLFGNTITDNYLFGLYNGPGSSAMMMPLTVYNGNDASTYSFGGNNTIMNNGFGAAPYTVSSPEIHITSSTPPEMDYGYNNIVDDREPPYGETSLLLESSEYTLDIKAERNFWGSMDFSYRFSNLNVSTGDYLSAASGYELNPNVYLVLSDTSGYPIDTVYAVAQVEGSLPSGGEMFGIAEALAAEGNYSAAEAYYEQMVAQWSDSGYVVKAATRLLFVKKMLNEDTQQLETYLTQKCNETNDENLRVALEYIKSLSQLSREEYGSASEVVAGIINGLPGTERGIYAEIDSVLIGIIASANAQTNAPGKANVIKDLPEIGDPNRLLSGYLKNKYGIGPRQETKKIIPAVFNLLQNYPNPFNPSTQIVYQIPKESEVTLKVYDLLGREVATLVNEKREAGEYTVTFEGKKLASGIYLYELRAGPSIPQGDSGSVRLVKKMILIR
ncbi:MAG: T9SS type A sorting domain-containing protein, partial [Ignavibacteriaceae bacterium]|nr:T9SS type A sorting domain-containing protein [Ignavibacteriaceae bacterium]